MNHEFSEDCRHPSTMKATYFDEGRSTTEKIRIIFLAIAVGITLIQFIKTGISGRFNSIKEKV